MKACVQNFVVCVHTKYHVRNIFLDTAFIFLVALLTNCVNQRTWQSQALCHPQPGKHPYWCHPHGHHRLHPNLHLDCHSLLSIHQGPRHPSPTPHRPTSCHDLLPLMRWCYHCSCLQRRSSCTRWINVTIYNGTIFTFSWCRYCGCCPTRSTKQLLYERTTYLLRTHQHGQQSAENQTLITSSTPSYLVRMKSIAHHHDEQELPSCSLFLDWLVRQSGQPSPRRTPMATLLRLSTTTGCTAAS
jgi:hypothetical protein